MPPGGGGGGGGGGKGLELSHVSNQILTINLEKSLAQMRNSPLHTSILLLRKK